MMMTGHELSDSFNDKPLINSAFLTMFRYALVSFAVIAVFCCFHSWELCYLTISAGASRRTNWTNCCKSPLFTSDTAQYSIPPCSQWSKV